MRLPITVLDVEKYHSWLNDESLTVDSNPPMITKVFVAYSKGPGTPVPVQIEIDQIITEYLGLVPTDTDKETLSDNQYYDKSNRANMLFRRNMLLAVVRGMDEDSANVLAHDSGAGRVILERLGYLRPEEDTEVEDNDDMGEDQKQNSETGE